MLHTVTILKHLRSHDLQTVGQYDLHKVLVIAENIASEFRDAFTDNCPCYGHPVRLPRCCRRIAVDLSSAADGQHSVCIGPGGILSAGTGYRLHGVGKCEWDGCCQQEQCGY